MTGFLSRLIALSGLALSVASGAATAQGMTDRPTVIVAQSVAGGGAGDALARLIAENLQAILKEPFQVENRPGGGGLLAAQSVVNSPPDGHRIFFATPSAMVVLPAMQPNLPIDPTKDFVPIATLATVTSVLVVRKDSPYHSVRDLVEAMKTRPFKHGTAGTGSFAHFTGEWFLSLTGTKGIHVPYNGSGQAVVGLMQGDLDFIFADPTPVAPLLASGDLRPLALTEKTAIPSLTKLPTMIESGFPEFEMGAWLGLVAPKGTPQDRIAKIALAMKQMSQNPDVQARLTRLSLDPYYKSPEEFAQMIAREAVRYKELAAKAGIAVK